MPLLALTNQRLGHNYDLYEFSTVPPTLPSGGGFSIKNFSLNTLYSEHNYCRNKWTRTNNDYPLVRYTGAKFKIHQPELIDLIITFDTQLPLRSNQEMYQTMQPSIHNMLKNRVIVPSRQTRTQKKPYTTIRVRPPNQILNKWYFQKDFAKLPLVQLRTSATTFTQFFQPTDSENNNITISFLSKTIQNRNIQKYPQTTGYSNRIQPQSGTHPAQPVYLYSTRQITSTDIQQTEVQYLIFLGQTKTAELGTEVINQKDNYTEKYWGNPFYWEYLKDTYPVLQSTMTVSQLIQYAKTSPTKKLAQLTSHPLSQIHLIDKLRYNPMRDWGKDNQMYIYPLFKDGQGWDPPEDPLYSQTIVSGLPLWLLPFGYTDFQYRAHSFARYDTDYITVLRTKYLNNIEQNLVLVSDSLIEGTSPHEEGPDPLDYNRWYPCIQFQLEQINNVLSSGPGVPKLRNDITAQATLDYTFYFKWGGNFPPMSSIQDPIDQPTYPIPNNNTQTIALQNPESNPEHILYNFDERRGMLTTRAIKRIKKNKEITTPFITDPESGHIPPVQTTAEETQTESSEEEEETQTLLNKLYQQRLKQQQLKLLILQKMNLQNIE